MASVYVVIIGSPNFNVIKLGNCSAVSITLLLFPPVFPRTIMFPFLSATILVTVDLSILALYYYLWCNYLY